ncbi:MAG: hypothetical protein QXU54_00250 [Candidatus Micrarchaeia archaeon]
MPYKFLYERSDTWLQRHEALELFGFSLLLLTLPFIIPGPQFITGTLVNAILILSALHLRGAQLMPIIMLPSIAVYVTGYIFGSASPALIYIIPAIWLGNSVLVFGMKYLHVHKGWGYARALLVSAAAKAAILFASAYALFTGNLIPQAILSAMGVIQLATALMGGALAYSVAGIMSACLRSRP